MTLEYVSPRRPGRVYRRTFDHEQARRRWLAGESQSALAREYGVSQSRISQVVSDVHSATIRYYQEHVKLAGRCQRCGAPTNRAAQYQGSRHCRDCAYKLLATSVRDDALRCFKCGQWKNDDDFPRSSAKTARRRGRHTACRACNTKARQAYRERHKVPCVGCGKPALPPNEKGAGGAAFPRCRECFVDSLRGRTVQARAEDLVPLTIGAESSDSR